MKTQFKPTYTFIHNGDERGFCIMQDSFEIDYGYESFDDARNTLRYILWVEETLSPPRI